MIRSFADRATEDLFYGRDTRAARRALPHHLWKAAAARLDTLDSATSIRDLRACPGNRLEKLRGDRSGQFSVRINRQFRVCFRWTDLGPADVEITDYH